MQAKSVLEVYGVQGLESHNNGVIMVNNHPVKEIKIMGRVLSCKSVSVSKVGVSANTDFFILELDDFSGDSSTISVKVPAAVTPVSYSTNPGTLLEVIGTVFYRQNYEKQILASETCVVGALDNFGAELKWWSAVLSIRRFLVEPWAYIPVNSSNRDAPISRFQSSASRLRREKASVFNNTPPSDVTNHTTSGLAFAKDSVVFSGSHRHNNRQQNAYTEVTWVSDSESPTWQASDTPSQELAEVIDLTQD